MQRTSTGFSNNEKLIEQTIRIKSAPGVQKSTWRWGKIRKRKPS